MSGDIKIPVSAEFDKTDIDKAIRDFTSQVNRLGTAIAQANKLKFNPVDKAATDDMRKLQQQFDALTRINSSLRQRIKATGQEGLGFQQLDWSRVYPESAQRGPAMRRAFDYVTAGTSMAGRMSAPPAPPAPPGRAPGPAPGGGGGGGGGYPGQGIIDAGLSAAGPAGSVASGALSAGMRGGFMAGLGGLFGGLAALGVSKVIGSVRDKLGSAEQESIGYDTLKRSLGDVGVEFEYLRGSLRQTAESLSLTYGEAQKLGMEFAKVSGMTQSYRTLAAEVGIGSGIGRSFGMDPGRGVGFMAQMRLAGSTGSETDSRRMAIMIGEAIGKVGFAKADAVMQAVASFSLQVARNSVSGANVSGYTGSLVSLINSGRPGLDAAGAASLLGRINSSVEGGGGAGEAGQNFMLAAIGRPMGLSPIRTRMQLQKGAFGMGAGGKTNIQMIMAGLRQQYGGLPEEFMFNAGANLLGINESQFAAFSQHGAGGQLNGIEARLKRAGIPLGALNTSAFGRLAAINSGSRADLLAEADRARADKNDPLSSKERAALEDAIKSGSVDALKDALVSIAATRDQENTEGAAVRKSLVGMENATQKLATELIPISITMRDALIATAGVIAPDSAFGRAQKDVAAIKSRDKLLESQASDLAAFDAETQSRLGELPASVRDDFLQKRAFLRQRKVGQQTADFVRAGGGMGGADELMAALIAQESGGVHIDPKTGRMLRNSRSGALGITQVMPGTGASPGFGVQPLQNDSQEEYVRFGRDYLNAMLKRYGGDKSKALAAYNWGPGNVDGAIGTYGDQWLSQAPGETQQYVSNIMKNQSMYGSAVPGSSTAGAGRGRGPTQAEVDVMFNFKDKSGAKVAPSVPVRVGVPTPSGQ